MEAILPYNTQDRLHLIDSAVEVGFEEFVAEKFFYTMQTSDLDIFPLMGRERLELLLYGWEVSQTHWDDLSNKEQMQENLHTTLKQLALYSLDIWFSKEWDQCLPNLRAALMWCLNRSRHLLKKLPGHRLFDWDYALSLGVRPWALPYLQKFVEAKNISNISITEASEQDEERASTEDIAHLEKEGLFLMLLRLIKLFDAGIMEGVRCLSMRVIAAWNHQYKQMSSNNSKSAATSEEHKQCLVLICHIYLMATYEMDDVRGFVIDNMINNIRFYHKCLDGDTSSDNSAVNDLEYTPARYIATTCINLGISITEFIDSFIYDTYDESFVSLFGVVSQAYMSYLLGNLLMQMNTLNENDFLENIDDYKRIMNLYIIERERSEKFMANEMHKKNRQANSHSMTATVQNMTDFKSKMCKGNRMSNIGSCDHMDADEERLILQEENEKCIDPVFQSVPIQEHVLTYVYGVLAQRKYKGWHYAKLTLLLKIIGMELNAIETWRYHPGLTTDFMINLDLKLSRRFEALAQIFNDHPFMEQEFWLTAFYLNPCNKFYQEVVRSGMRNNRNNRTNRLNAIEGEEKEEEEEDDDDDENPAINMANIKFGLLSSTIDVHIIDRLANHESPELDYKPLSEALRAFKLPDHVIKDLLTVTFLARNKNFAWVVSWPELRQRCKNLLKISAEKRRLVELNMAEANDRLKYLNIDYEKYKHRPQLDYGSIEEGYENGTVFSNENNDNVEDDDDDEEEDFEADSDLDTPHKEEPKKDDHSEFFDTYFMSTRRTRARAAAIMATTFLKENTHKDTNSDKVLEKETCTKTLETEETNIPDKSLSDNNQDAQDVQTVDNSLSYLKTTKVWKNFLKLKKMRRMLANTNKRKSEEEESLESDSKRTKMDEMDTDVSAESDESDMSSNTGSSEYDGEMTQDENYDSDVSTVAQQDSNEVTESVVLLELTENLNVFCPERHIQGVPSANGSDGQICGKSEISNNTIHLPTTRPEAEDIERESESTATEKLEEERDIQPTEILKHKEATEEIAVENVQGELKISPLEVALESKERTHTNEIIEHKTQDGTIITEAGVDNSQKQEIGFLTEVKDEDTSIKEVTGATFVPEITLAIKTGDKQEGTTKTATGVENLQEQRIELLTEITALDTSTQVNDTKIPVLLEATEGTNIMATGVENMQEEQIDFSTEIREADNSTQVRDTAAVNTGEKKKVITITATGIGLNLEEQQIAIHAEVTDKNTEITAVAEVTPPVSAGTEDTNVTATSVENSQDQKIEIHTEVTDTDTPTRVNDPETPVPPEKEGTNVTATDVENLSEQQSEFTKEKADAENSTQKKDTETTTVSELTLTDTTDKEQEATFAVKTQQGESLIRATLTIPEIDLATEANDENNYAQQKCKQPTVLQESMEETKGITVEEKQEELTTPVLNADIVQIQRSNLLAEKNDAAAFAEAQVVRPSVIPESSDTSDASKTEIVGSDSFTDKNDMENLATPIKPVESVSTEEANSIDSDCTAKSEDRRPTQDELLKLVSKKQVRICLHRLKCNDYNLRQPKVVLERLNMDVVNAHVSKRRIKRKVFFDSDDTSKSSSGSMYGDRSLAHLLKNKNKLYSSSSESEDRKKKRRGTRPGNSSGGSVARGRSRKMVVTPRSGNGLKMCISSKSTEDLPAASTSNATKTPNFKIVDYIQLNSTSSSEDTADSKYSAKEDGPGESHQMMMDPLYEEEIIPIFRTKRT